MRTMFALLLLFTCGQVLPLQAEELPGRSSKVDPFESFNRVIFEFNDELDTWVLRPVAKGYHFVMPDFAERGVGNFFANLFDVTSAFNSLLQGRFDNAARGGGRVLVNSTLGLLGFFDVASPMGIEPYRTDFGHTLAVWGVPSGPYIMVPVLGPRTVRSGTGSIVEFYTAPQAYVDKLGVRLSLYALELIDIRASLLEADELISGDRYIFVRDVYLQQREALANEGKMDDSFSDFGQDGVWEEDF